MIRVKRNSLVDGPRQKKTQRLSSDKRTERKKEKELLRSRGSLAPNLPEKGKTIARGKGEVDEKNENEKEKKKQQQYGEQHLEERQFAFPYLSKSSSVLK